jgi:hypothetical protein
MAGRNLGETTVAWLERLISSGASDAQINGVSNILAAERPQPTPGTGKFLFFLLVRCYKNC